MAEPSDSAVPPDVSQDERLAMRAALLTVPPGQRAVLVLPTTKSEPAAIGMALVAKRG